MICYNSSTTELGHIILAYTFKNRNGPQSDQQILTWAIKQMEKFISGNKSMLKDTAIRLQAAISAAHAILNNQSIINELRQ